jgi:hypothetical protein
MTGFISMLKRAARGAAAAHEPRPPPRHFRAPRRGEPGIQGPVKGARSWITGSRRSLAIGPAKNRTRWSTPRK